MTPWILLGVALLLIAACAVFVAAEFSFVTVDRAAAERAAQSGDKRARSLMLGVRQLSTQLSGAQLGITLTSLIIGFIAEPSLAYLLRGPMASLGLATGTAAALSLALALAIATAVQMILGELVPKNLAIADPLAVGRAVAPIQRGFTRLASPLIRVFNGMANAILRLMKIEPREELASARSADELVSLVVHSGREGTLDPTTADLVTRSLEFGELTAADVMTPRPRVRFIDADATAADVLDATIATGFARFPVIGENSDDIVGLVHFKQALAVPVGERAMVPVRSIMGVARTVPDTIELDPLLDVLRSPGLQAALVIDEYGGTAGLVTLEDLIEEIVGDIADEQDAPARLHTQGDDGSWSISGLLRPDEAGEVLGVELPEGQDTETIGGLIMERLGRLPQVGDSIEVDATTTVDAESATEPIHVSLTVIRLDGRRADRIRAVVEPRGSDAS